MKHAIRALAVSLFFLCGLSAFAQAPAEISAEDINDLRVEVAWSTSSSIVMIEYKRLDVTSDWRSLTPEALVGADKGHPTYGGIKSPGLGIVALSNAGQYSFRVTECSVVPMGSMGSNLTLVCGPNKPFYGGTYNGAVANSGPVNVGLHLADEYTATPDSTTSPTAYGITAGAVDQYGKVQLDWYSKDSFVEIQQMVDQEGHWSNVWRIGSSEPGEYPTVQISIPNSPAGTTEIAPKGTGISYATQPGVYTYRMRYCYIYSSDGTSFSRRCNSTYVYSKPVVVEALGLNNLPPIVSFTAPSANTQVVTGSSVTAKVAVSDPAVAGFINRASAIAKVEFYITRTPGQLVAPAQLAHTATTPVNGLYQYSFSANQAGDYYIVAVATDTGGASAYAVSSVRAVTAQTAASQPNNTQPIKLDRYATYYGDFDGDGYQDIYLHGTPLVIILHGDIATPIQLAAPPGFAYFGTADGSYQEALAWDMTDDAVKNCSGCRRAQAGTDFVIGDMNGDGHPDILIKGVNRDVGSLLISGTEGQTLPQVLLEILPTGQTRRPGRDASQTPYFTDNLRGNSTVGIAGGNLQVNGQSHSLTKLQQVVSTEGASLATDQKIQSPAVASLPSPSLSPAELAEIDTISSLGGEFRVSEMGAATYYVPLALPAGTAGVAPELAFTYSSQAGVGDMGLGWSLASGSSIGRCRQTLQADRHTQPIKFGIGDRFCLDGQRLLRKGAGIYGAVGAVYRLEIDNGTEVTSVGGTDGNPDFFVARAKDGSISTFGGANPTGSSAHEAEVHGRDATGTLQPNRVMNWQLSEFKDSANNKIAYTYKSSASFHRLESVSYGYGTTSTPDVRVTFTYGTRKKTEPAWVSGSRFMDNSLLLAVGITDQDRVVREYRIGYNQGVYKSGSDFADRVTSIKACLGDQCSRPLRTEWGFASAGAANKGNGRVNTYVDNVFDTTAANFSMSGFPAEQIKLEDSTGSSWSIKDFDFSVSSSHWHLSYLESDINGDGLPDLLGISAYNYTGGSKGFSIYSWLQNSTGIGKRESVGQFDGDPYAADNRDMPQAQSVDFNADGRSDLAVYSPSTKTWRTYISEPQTSGHWKLMPRTVLPAGIPDNLRFADVNSDGLPDAVYTNGSELVVHLLERKPSSTPEEEAAITISNQAYRFRTTPIKSPAPGYDTHNFGGASDIDEDGKVDLLAPAMALSETVGAMREVVDDFGTHEHTPYTCTYKIDLRFMTLSSPTTFSGRSVPALEGSYTAEKIVQVYPMSDDGQQQRTTTQFIIAQCTQKDFRRRFIGPFLTDINADGLADLVWAFANPRYTTSFTSKKDPEYHFKSVSYKLGKADGTFGGRVDANLAVEGLGLEVMDFNSDGNQDLVVTGKDDAKWTASWTNGTFSAAKSLLAASAGRQTRYSDLNADGYIDKLQVVSGKLTAAKGTPKTNNVVVRFQTGMGAVTSVFYEPLRDSGRYAKLGGISVEQTGTTNGGTACYPGGCTTYESQPIYGVNSEEFYRQINDPFYDVDPATHLEAAKGIPTMELIGAMPVVTRVASSAPTADNARALAGIDYAYEGLKVQAGGRGMLGFKKLSTTDMQTGIVTETQYRQDWPFMGTPLKTITKTHHGQLINESTTDMAIVGIDISNIDEKRKLGETKGTAQLGPLVLYAAKAVDTTYDVPESLLAMPDGTNPTVTLTKKELSQQITISTVDAEGNNTETTTETWGFDSAETRVWRRLRKQTTLNTYYSGEGERYGRLKKAEATTERYDAVTLTRTADFTYYDYPGAACAGAANLKGLLCSEQITVSNLTQSQAPEMTRHYYDAVGNNIFSKTGTRLSPMAEYDGKGRFVQATYDVFRRESGQGEGAPASGYLAPADAVVVKTGEVLLRDKFGNSILSRKALGSGNWLYSSQAATPMGTLFFKGDSTGAFEETRMQRTVLMQANWCAAGAVYVSTVNRAGGGQASTCYDRLGRDIGGYIAGFNGEAIRTRKDYDQLGRVVKVSEPASAAVPNLFTRTAYDVLGRPIRVTHPFNITSSTGGESSSPATTIYAYEGFSSTISVSGRTGDAARTTQEVKNALGQLVSVTEMGSRSVKYSYDALGNLTGTVDPHGNASTIAYNGLGQKVSMADPDKGYWRYFYNSYGEMTRQVDANSTSTVNTYDFKGRLTYQAVTPTNGSAPHAVRWDYDLAENGLGHAAREVKTGANSVTQFTRQQSFDKLGRPSVIMTTFKGAGSHDESHYQKITYDAFGRPFQTFDSARSGPQFTYNGIQNRYNAYGYLDQVQDAANGGSAPFYTVKAVDARGNVTHMDYGNGERAIYTYHPRNGFLTKITRFDVMGLQQAYVATWDHLGNLVERKNDLLGGTVETFSYDHYNRLKTNTLDGKTVTVAYDAIDNITSKSDVEGGLTYQYHSTKKHAVVTVGSRGFIPDANGNIVKETFNGTDKKIFEYTGNDLVSKIAVTGTNAHTSEFFYGSDNQRYKRIDIDAKGRKTTTLYLGSVEKIHYSDNTVEWKRNVGGVAQVIHRVAGGKADAGVRQYFHKDHLGSITAITDSAGTILQRMAFDPWGARRNISNGAWQPSSMTETSVLASYAKTAKPLTNRGFTGHEMLDEVGIIHMNGRIYDATLARFLQADPIIQAPTMIGSLNRYSYTMNNPLNAVDPTGFSWLSKAWKKLRPYVGTIVGIAIAIWQPWALTTWYGAFAAGAVSGAAGAAATGGNILQGALVGGVSAAAFYGVGRYFSNLSSTSCAINSSTGQYYNFGGNMLTAGQVAGQITAHATVGGVLSVVQGGKFGHGFVSAGVTKGMTNLQLAADRIGDGIGALAAGMTGGTVSAMTGGKFANGFQTSAFQYLFNAKATELAKGAQKALGESGQARVNRALEEIYEEHPGLTRPKDLKVLAINGEHPDSKPGARVHGEYVDNARIDIYHEGRTDYQLKADVFHELLHMDEAHVAAYGNHSYWYVREIVTQGGHDPWVTSAWKQAERYYQAESIGPGYAERLGYTKPNINDAPWRQ